jgi:hypothetical protein
MHRERYDNGKQWALIYTAATKAVGFAIATDVAIKTTNKQLHNYSNL